MNQFHAQPTKTGSVHVRKLCYSLGLWLILVSDLLNHIVSVFVTITIAVFTKVITIIVIIIFMIVVVVIIIITYRILT